MGSRTDAIRVLHVDDDPAFVDMVATFLEREDDRIDVVTATSGTDGLTILDERAVDCIVSDYDVPGLNGIEFLERVRQEYGDLPFVLFTGKGTGKSPARRSLRASPTTPRKTPAPNSTRCWQTES